MFLCDICIQTDLEVEIPIWLTRILTRFVTLLSFSDFFYIKGVHATEIISALTTK